MHHHHVTALATVRDISVVLPPGADVGVEAVAIVVAAHEVTLALEVVVAVAVAQSTRVVVAVRVG